MDVITTPIDGLLILRPDVYRDHRGYFLETWNKKRYVEAGIDCEFVQDNHSASTKGVLRGIHFQKVYPQGKLISVSAGLVYDVAVDLRQGSPTFGQWFGTYLDTEKHEQFWLPPGMGHAFCVLSNTANFHYKCTDYYHPGDEKTIIWNDPDLAITWPSSEPIISDKDARAPTLKEWMASDA